MTKFRIGVQLHPQHTTYASIAEAARRADQHGRRLHLGVGSFLSRYTATLTATILRLIRCWQPWQPRPVMLSWASWSPATATATPTCWPI